ncbi:MAG: amidohydrolase family protein [Anaerolineales bacterium]|nr:amidohydrolase family protein [Anaerolineales bacterium]
MSAAVTYLNARVVGAAADSLRVARGRVAALGERPAPGDAVVDLDGAFVFPGLINAHDHLQLNNFARLKWRDRYANARDWIADFQPRWAADPRLLGPLAVPLPARLFQGALKNLLSGATTVAHHDPAHYTFHRRDFPVRVVSRMCYSHSLGVQGERAVAAAYRRTPRGWPWIIHAAEGVDAAAAAEADALAALGCLGANTLLVHGVALHPAAWAALAARGVGLVWCPASNDFLFGATAPVADLAARGRVALGSDSRLSGAADLLAELRCAAATGQVDAAALLRLVTIDAAALLRLPQAGRLAVGAPADLLALPALAATPAATLLAATRADVRLVLVAGQPRYADAPGAFAANGSAASRATVDGRPKVLSAAIARRLAHLGVAEPGVTLDGA